MTQAATEDQEVTWGGDRGTELRPGASYGRDVPLTPKCNKAITFEISDHSSFDKKTVLKEAVSSFLHLDI